MITEKKLDHVKCYPEENRARKPHEILHFPCKSGTCPLRWKTSHEIAVKLNIKKKAK